MILINTLIMISWVRLKYPAGYFLIALDEQKLVACGSLR
jgi:hypothetical protein